MGKYSVQVGPESAEVVVEDAPYMVRSVTIEEAPDGRPRAYVLHLNDETRESLESGSLVVSEQNVMYCKVKEGTERARFLRAAYYQICSRLEYDETSDVYWLPCRDARIGISPAEPQVRRQGEKAGAQERTPNG